MPFNALELNKKSYLTLVMPVLNEGVRVIPTISTLAFTVKVPLNLIIVYDNPDDNTIPVLRDLLEIFPNISLIRNRGKGVIGAISTGFEFSETEIIGVWIPYHVDPYGLINKMYDLANNGCSLVSGNRFNKVKRITRGSMVKKLLSRGGNYVLNRIIGVPFGDVTTSIKLYNKKFLDKTPIETKLSGGWALSTELAIKASVGGYKLGEVEFMPENTNIIRGVSNFKVFKQLDQYIKWLFYGFKNRRLIINNYANKKNFLH